MSHITTVIFDMYETLVENEHGQWRETFKEIIRRQDLNVDPETLWETWRGLEGKFRDRRVNPGAPFQTYFQGWTGTFEETFTSLGLTGDSRAATHKSIEDLSQRAPYHETQQALRLVQARCRTAILSNADEDYLRPNLRLLGDEIVAGLSAVLTSEEARCYKPQPELFQEMLRRLGAAAQECLYVGDRQFEDVQGAGGVGIVTVWLNRSRSETDPRLPAPDHQIHSLLEIPELLDRIAESKDGAH